MKQGKLNLNKPLSYRVLSTGTWRQTLTPEAKKAVTEKFLRKVGLTKKPSLTKSEFSGFVTATNAFYSERLFAIIPKLDPLNLQLHELLSFLTIFINYDNEQKIDFLFRLFDANDNGELDITELHKMLEVSMIENGIEMDNEILDDLTSALLGKINEGNDEEYRTYLNKQDFHKLFENHEELLENISTIIEKLMIPCEKKRKGVQCNFRFIRRFGKYLRNNSFLLSWVLLYFGVNLGLFIFRFWIFSMEFEQLGSNIYLAIARSAGFCLDFNCGFILVTMARHWLTRLRSTRFGRLFPIDEHRFFHELTASMIILFGFIHMTAHILNVCFHVIPNQNITFSYPWVYLVEFLFTPNLTQHLGLIPGIAYITGFAITGVLILMTLLALPAVRRNGYFHLFYLSHNICYPIFIGLTVIHCKNFWKWLIIPGTIFIIEQIYRAYHTWITAKTTVISGVPLPSKITFLSIKRPYDFEFNCGDYVFIRIPEFSRFEWHPFTISSAPENREEITLHIQAVGPWTTSLFERFDFIRRRSMPVVHKYSFRSPRQGSVEGPFEHKEYAASRTKSLPPVSRVRVVNNTTVDEQKDIHGKVDEIQAELDDIQSRLTSANSFRHLRRDPLMGRTKYAVPFHDINKTGTFTSVSHNLGKEIASRSSLSFVKVEIEEVMETDELMEKQLTVQLDGPYGAPACSIYNVEHAVLIGAGIGVTPFASILQSIMYRHWESKVTCSNCNHTFSHGFQWRVNRLKKVDFHWINKDRKSFGWFTDLLSKLEIEQQELSSQQQVNGIVDDKFLDIHMYLTRALKRNDMRAIALHLAMDLHYLRSKKDVLAGLKSRVKAGRPDWKKIFEDLRQNKKGNVVVFFCGPSQLGALLKKHCEDYSFDFRTEVF